MTDRYGPRSGWSLVRPRDAIDRLRAEGIPLKFIYRCTYISDRPFIDIEQPGDVELDELTELFKRGVGLIIHPSAVFDLFELGDALSYIPELRLLQSTSGKYLNIRALEGAIRLEGIYVSAEQDEWADISQLPVLESVSAAGVQGLAGARNPHLRRLRLEIDRLPDDFGTNAPLEQLWINAGKSLRDLSAFTDLSNLTAFEVQRASRFELSKLAHAKELTSLELVYCHEVTGIEGIVDLPNLSSLRFYGVHSIPGRDAVQRFRGNLFVEGNYVFDEDFQARFVGDGKARFSRYKLTRAGASQ